TPCSRVIASSLRLSHTAAALWSLRSSHQSNAKAAAKQVAEGDSDALRERSEHLRDLRFLTNKDRDALNLLPPNTSKSKSQTLTLHGNSSEKTPKHKTPNPQNEPRAHPDGQYLMSNHS
ncbi:MAG: hypothetical protein IJB12_04895, partial [Methanocorpusculum sp.]|nr:hypothetical protein [Methanocorpusculum sp.]